ncbi:MAG: RidA family protein [Alphaproteobacteria bacterium]|nr:RidA family protein [Alphaproteobacteria bacterium]
MAKITRYNPSPILSRVVEYHGFVFVSGVTAKDRSKDIKGQTKEVLDQIDAALELAGTDKTRLLEATIWLKDIKQRDAMNEVWIAWLGSKDNLPARACVQAEMGAPDVLVEIKLSACK